ncbi:MAG: molybdopterin-dependent oxidoreductase [Chromatiales bacterium]|jgi:isoquinoline 1-oxidoreductase beta subunit
MDDFDKKDKKNLSQMQSSEDRHVQIGTNTGSSFNHYANDAPYLSQTTRRRFLQYTLAGTTSLIVGGAWFECEDTEASLAVPEFGELLDIGDVIKLVESTYEDNLVLEVTHDNRIRFELPRLEMGQGVATAVAMLVADELDADYELTDVVLSDRRADRPFSITAGSSSIRTMWDPVRKLSAQVRARLVTAAARRWNMRPELLSTFDSKVHGPGGLVATYGELTADAAKVIKPLVSILPKSLSEYTTIGKARQRKDARDIVTGRMVYTLDVQVSGALPTVIAHSPDIHGVLIAWDDTQARSMPGVVDVVQISSGIAVIAQTFHQAFRAREVLDMQWSPGPVAGRFDDDMRNELEAASPPLEPVYWPLRSHTAVFEYPFIAHAMMEVMAAVADVRGGEAEIWYASQSPNYIAKEVSNATGIPASKVKIHTPFAGSSFGHRLFGEVAAEAAEVSQAAGRPVKLMWSRSDNMRRDHFRPMARCAIRASWIGASTLTFEHKITAATTGFDHGLGDALTSAGSSMSPSEVSQLVFHSMVSLPYRFGVTSHQLTECDFGVTTGSWRSVFSGLTTTSNEIFIDALARERGCDEVLFRQRNLDNETVRRCLGKVAEMGEWGRSMPKGHAQGVAIHTEYRSACAYLVEIDTTSDVPRLTRAYCAVDVGVPINPRGLEAQMQGMLVDAWSIMFRVDIHIDDGRVRESGFRDYPWACMKHTPPCIQVHVFPAQTGSEAGGAGELGIPAAAAACVNAYARATGIQPSRFPIGEVVK